MSTDQLTNELRDFHAPSTVELSFDWTPAGTWTYADLSAPDAPVNVEVTFTAHTTIHDPAGRLTIVGYRWEFGDGTVGFGPVARHTYIVPNPYLQTVLRVTDNLGREWSTRAQMYLPGTPGLSGGWIDISGWLYSRTGSQTATAFATVERSATWTTTDAYSLHLISDSSFVAAVAAVDRDTWTGAMTPGSGLWPVNTGDEVTLTFDLNVTQQLDNWYVEFAWYRDLSGTITWDGFSDHFLTDVIIVGGESAIYNGFSATATAPYFFGDQGYVVPQIVASGEGTSEIYVDNVTLSIGSLSGKINPVNPDGSPLA